MLLKFKVWFWFWYRIRFKTTHGLRKKKKVLEFKDYEKNSFSKISYIQQKQLAKSAHGHNNVKLF